MTAFCIVNMATCPLPPPGVWGTATGYRGTQVEGRKTGVSKGPSTLKARVPGWSLGASFIFKWPEAPAVFAAPLGGPRPVVNCHPAHWVLSAHRTPSVALVTSSHPSALADSVSEAALYLEMDQGESSRPVGRRLVCHRGWWWWCWWLTHHCFYENNEASVFQVRQFWLL